jgi:histidinol-phosphate phosphatase family protein
MSSLKIDKTWTLFLDRDGVINEKQENDYIKSWGEFSFIPGSLEAISSLSKIFKRIIIVTNQRGIGRGFMEAKDLNSIHEKMIKAIKLNAGFITKIYFCSDLSDDSECRKPNIGMATLAKLDFPEIDFKKSIIVGDSCSDMIFGERLKMKKVLICKSDVKFDSDWKFKSLHEFSMNISKLSLEFK